MTESDRDAEGSACDPEIQRAVAGQQGELVGRDRPGKAGGGGTASPASEFPITLAFFPLWIAAELMAIFYPDTYWNKNAKQVIAAFRSLCWRGLLSWLSVGTYLLLVIGN